MRDWVPVHFSVSRFLWMVMRNWKGCSEVGVLLVAYCSCAFGSPIASAHALSL